MYRLHLDVDATPWRLGLVRHAAETWLRHAPWPEHASGMLVFALSEVVSNSVEHAYRTLETGRVVVELAIEDVDPGHQRVCAVVTDSGRWRDTPSEEDRGNGLRLVQSVMASVDVHSDSRGTRVRMYGPSVAGPERSAADR